MSDVTKAARTDYDAEQSLESYTSMSGKSDWYDALAQLGER
jgi:hypothetical protein